jgi:hypothetical protein
LKVPEPNQLEKQGSLAFAAFLKILPDNPGIAPTPQNQRITATVMARYMWN